MANTLDIIIKASDMTGPAFASIKSGVDGVVTKFGGLDAIGEKMRGLGMGLSLGLTLPIGAAGLAAVNMASDMDETGTKVGEIFGTMSTSIMAWSETTAQSIGQSQQQALDAASTFGIFGKAAGLSGQDLVDFSRDFTVLASDLASFNNTTPEEAIVAIGAALRGESEPLRAYGVLLDDATLRQAALELGIIETTKNALTPQQKVLAAQKVIYEQTSTAQGDFARTSDGLANQQRILTAEFKDVGTELGVVLLPLAKQLVEWLRSAVDWFGNLSPEMKTAIVVVGGLAAALGPVLVVLGSIIGAVVTLMPILTAIGGVFAAVAGIIGAPVIGIIAVVAAVVAGLALLVKAWNSDWGGIKTKTTEFVEWIGDSISGLWKGITKWFKDGIDSAGKMLSDFFKGVMDWFNPLRWIEMGKDLVGGIIEGIKKAASGIFDGLKNAVSGAIDGVKNFLGIRSPSLVAAKEIGLPFAQGIGAGIRSGMPAAMRNVTNNNTWNIELVGGASAGQDVYNTVQLMSALYG